MMSPAFLIVPAVAALATLAALLPLLARRRSDWRRSPRRVVIGAHPRLGDGERARERGARAERRARELLRQVAGEDAYAMYSQLGFVAAEGGAEDGYGYLIYPHRPIVAYDAGSGELLSEYCVRFPDGSDPEAGEWLPDADDVLAKWMALRGDERRLIGEANMHLPGRQLDPGMVRRDLEILRAWRDARALRRQAEERPV